MIPEFVALENRIYAELAGLAMCLRGCESHNAVELNLAFVKYINACAAQRAHATKRVLLAKRKVQRTEHKMPRTKRSEAVAVEQAEEPTATEYTFPKTIGACVDRAYLLREKRLKLEREAAAIKSEEEALKNHVLEEFGQDEVEGVKGKVATASITKRVTGTVADWGALYEYIKKNEAFDMLHRRLSDAAYRERLDAGEEVPGVKPFTVVNLSLTKR